MQYRQVNPIIQWWMTPKLPYQDIYELPLLKSKGSLAKYSHLFTAWVIHPIKRRLARVYLKFLQKFTDIKIIGVTGSAGKSSTVGLLESILRLDGPTVATPHSIDPVYNIPNTILRCKPDTRYLILEMSVEYPGEMDYYLWLGVPDVGVILNIFPSHLANLGSIEGVLDEKSKLVKGLRDLGVAVLNSHDSLLKGLKRNIKVKIEWFAGDNDLVQNNINAAKAVAHTFAISKNLISKGLALQKNPSHRLELITLGNGVKVLDDTYNSNPKAAISALDYFDKMAKGRRIAVLGDMLELGDYEKAAHAEIGKKVTKMRFHTVIGVGTAIKTTLDTVRKRSRTTKTFLCKDYEEAVKLTKSLMVKGDWLFVKGSRSIGLDRLVSELTIRM